MAYIDASIVADLRVQRAIKKVSQCEDAMDIGPTSVLE